MRSIKINPNTKEVTEVKLKGGLAELQEHVGGMIGVFHWPEYQSDCIYCDDFPSDEAKGFVGAGFVVPVFNSVLLVGPPDNVGNSTTCTADLESVKEGVSWV